MVREEEEAPKQLPPPWDRIFSLSSRIFVWGLLFGIIYILRPFFLLLFLTFVFAYILEHGVRRLAPWIRNRPLRVTTMAALLLGTLTTVGVFLATPLQQQASKLLDKYPSYLAAIDNEIDSARESSETLKAMIPEGLDAADLINNLLGLVNATSEEFVPVELPPDDPPSLGPPPGSEDEVQPGPPADPEQIMLAYERLKNIVTPILGIGSAFLLSLLFSILIVLDLPKLSRAVAGLAGTKVGFIYDEVAGNVHDFGMMLGRALEAQLLIALCNTILTAIGLYFLGLTGNLVFLSSVVFFCSFIPVAGVFVSSVPICIEALSQEGPQLMLIAVGMILIIHMIEAYLLNPRIFGHHLHMNAVLVLIVLTIAGKLFGVWGLVLGLPVVNYFFGRAIRHPEEVLPLVKEPNKPTKPEAP